MNNGWFGDGCGRHEGRQNKPWLVRGELGRGGWGPGGRGKGGEGGGHASDPGELLDLPTRSIRSEFLPVRRTWTYRIS